MKSIYPPIRSTVVFDKAGPIRFGGKPVHQILMPKGTHYHLHHVLALPADHPLFPLEDFAAPELPLVFPLRYDWGSAGFQYEVCPDASLRIVHMGDSGTEELGMDDLPFFDSLPEYRGTLRKLSYEEARASSFADLSPSSMAFSREDSAWLASSGWKNGIQVGGPLLPGRAPFVCQNRACAWKGKESQSVPIAVVRDTPVKGVSIFGSSDVSMYFGYCGSCGAIVAGNVCS